MLLDHQPLQEAHQVAAEPEVEPEDPLIESAKVVVALENNKEGSFDNEDDDDFELTIPDERDSGDEQQNPVHARDTHDAPDFKRKCVLPDLE